MDATISTQRQASLEELVEQVQRAALARTPLAIRGGNTKLWYGHRVEGEPLDVRGYAGIVDYEPSELVITARAGTPLAEIAAALAEHEQMLAFEPPLSSLALMGPHPGPLPLGEGRGRDGEFAEHAPRPSSGSGLQAGTRTASEGIAAVGQATLGGCVATGLSGPRRQASGAVRDFMLGAKLIDGRGQVLSFGGQVMKNVAGYDVSRALAGSLGTLGVIAEVSLKVLPRPAGSTTLAFSMGQEKALTQFNEWAGMPLAITASAWRASAASPRSGTLRVRLEGSEAALQSGIRRIGGLDVDPDEATASWAGIREQTDAFFEERPADAPLWRLSLPSTAAPLDPKALGFADQLIEWGGALRWIATRADADTVREAAAAAGGHATLYRASDPLKERHGVFQPLAPAIMAIHRRLKTEFDPHGIFNRGRMYRDL